MGPQAALLPCGKRLHLQHGPIDLIIGADGDRARAFAAAQARFDGLLTGLVEELPALRMKMSPDIEPPEGSVARRMDAAVRPYAGEVFVSRMAAVAGSVADAVLQSMVEAANLTRAYVNNGGDIALHLTHGTQFDMAMSGHDGGDLGRITIRAKDPVRGIATSGWHGRSFSLGIADSVTVLAATAAQADVAATLIANAVDLPDHPMIARAPANEIDDASDLGDLPVVTGCGALSPDETAAALDAGLARAQDYQRKSRILGAALFLHGESRVTRSPAFSIPTRILEHV